MQRKSDVFQVIQVHLQRGGKKKVLDEELLFNCNRTLARLNLTFDPMLAERLAGSLEANSWYEINPTDRIEISQNH